MKLQRFPFRYVDGWPDRHGHPRLYYRVGKGSRILLEGKCDPVTGAYDDVFLASYRAAEKQMWPNGLPPLSRKKKQHPWMRNAPRLARFVPSSPTSQSGDLGTVEEKEHD